MIVQFSTFQSINNIKKSSFRTGFGIAKIRDTESSISKKNGINAILSLCFTALKCDKNWIPHHATQLCCVLCGMTAYVIFNIIKS